MTSITVSATLLPGFVNNKSKSKSKFTLTPTILSGHTTHAMQKELRFRRKIEVDHHVQQRNINTSSGHICHNQKAALSRTEQGLIIVISAKKESGKRNGNEGNREKDGT